MNASGPEPAASVATPRLWPAVLGGWALVSCVLLLLALPEVAAWRFPDPDDAMRLLEVRDWLAGQSWWDVAQHRLNHGDFPMHWSRLVDLPLAGAMIVLDPVFGAATGDRIAAVVVPIATLLAIMALAAAITRRAAGVEPARLAVLVVALSTPIVAQARPLRIDHHGWQVALALAAVLVLLGRPSARRGAATGAILGTLLTVSLEGMPIAASVAGVAALYWAIDPRARGQLIALGWSLAGSALFLHIATRGPGAFAPACDAISPTWLGALVVAATGVTFSTALSRFSLPVRLAALATTAVLAGMVLRIAAPVCLEGPFATLPPLVYRLWYLQVGEGRPLWEQPASWAWLTIGLPLAGIAGSAHAARGATGEVRARWLMLLALQFAATGVAIMVNRAGATANAIAVPGASALLLALLTRARAVPATGRRVLATLGALLLASPGQVGAMVFAAAQHREAASDAAAAGAPPRCTSFADVAALAALPPGLVFAPVDISPEILVTTSHRALAGGYHRGAHAIDAVMRAFLARPGQAMAAIRASGADYVALCPGVNEIDVYAALSPNGLAARLARGERVAGLAPIRLPGARVLAWRVTHPLPGAPAHP